MNTRQQQVFDKILGELEGYQFKARIAGYNQHGEIVYKTQDFQVGQKKSVEYLLFLYEKLLRASENNFANILNLKDRAEKGETFRFYIEPTMLGLHFRRENDYLWIWDPKSERMAKPSSGHISDLYRDMINTFGLSREFMAYFTELAKEETGLPLTISSKKTFTLMESEMKSLKEDFSKTEKKEIEGIADKEFESLIKDAIKKHLSSKEFTGAVNDIVKKNIVNLYKTLWTRRNMWSNSLSEGRKTKRELLDEVTDSGSVGSYEQPGVWAKNKENWRYGKTPVMPGGQIVQINPKCEEFPYCNQGDPEALILRQGRKKSK